MFAASRVLPFALLSFLQEAVVILATSAAEGLFLKRVGSQLLPGAYLLSAVVSASFSLFYGGIRSRFDSRTLTLGTTLAFGLVTLAVAGPLDASIRPAFYLYLAVVSVFVMIARIQLWSEDRKSVV